MAVPFRAGQDRISLPMPHEATRSHAQQELVSPPFWGLVSLAHCRKMGAETFRGDSPMYGFQKRPHQAPPAAPPDDASARGFRPPVRRDLDRAENESTRGGAGLGFRAGGLVRGPGTGTSDSVKTSVPEGTYIMPADSTQQIGPEALSAVGFRPGSKPKAPNIPGIVDAGRKLTSKRGVYRPKTDQGV